MTTLRLTQADFDRGAHKSAQAGDIIELAGTFVNWRINGFRPDGIVTIDASKADRLETCYHRDIANVEFVGGKWLCPPVDYKAATAALRIDKFDNVTVRDAEFSGTKPGQNSGTGLMAVGGTDLTVYNVKAQELFYGVKVGRSVGFVGTKITGFKLGSDAVHCASVSKARVANNFVDQGNLAPDAHADGVQFYTEPGFDDCEDLTIEDNIYRGNTQGIGLFGPGRRKHVVIRRNSILTCQPQGIGAHKCDGLILEDNEVETMDGAEYQTRIDVHDCTDVTRERNFVAAGAGKKAETDADWQGPLRGLARTAADVPHPEKQDDPEVISITLKPGQRLEVTAPAA